MKAYSINKHIRLVIQHIETPNEVLVVVVTEYLP